MNFLDLLTMSVNNLWRRKLRTFLTVLGVIIGTASIVVMISLGMGMNKANMEQIEKYGGLTTINVYANENGSSTHYGSGTAVSDGGVSGSGSGKNEPVRLDDAMIEKYSACFFCFSDADHECGGQAGCLYLFIFECGGHGAGSFYTDEY